MAYAMTTFTNGASKRNRAACTEENELLDANSIKMSDAPFSRHDSEEDMLEDYDSSLTFSLKSPCCQQRTGLERLLLLLLLVATVVILGLAVGLTRPQVVPVTKYCQSPACVKASSSVLSSVDWSVSPCKNFYQFACGHWLKSRPIPKGYHHWDRFQELSGNNLYILSTLIESSTGLGSAETKTRSLYSSCMSSTPDKRAEVLRQFSALIDAAGGWSLSNDSKSMEGWTLLTGLQQAHMRGAWPFFKLDVEVDERDPTRLHIIKIDVGETALQADLLPFMNGTQNHGNDSESYAIKDAAELTAVLLEETVHIFKSFGANDTYAKKLAQDVITLETKLIYASQGYHHIHDRFSLYNVMTVADLEYNYTSIVWLDYLRDLGFDNVNSDTEVVIRHPDYMKSITALLGDYYLRGSEDNKTTLRNYLAISLIRSFKPYFDKDLFKIEETEQDEMEEKWKRCTFYTNNAIGFSTGAMYVKGTNSEGSVEKMEKLILFVKNAFKDYLLSKYWMDKRTRSRAEKKVDAIIDKISYPSFIMNGTFLDEYYENFQVNNSDWFSNLLSWRRFLLGNMNSDLEAVPDRKKSWLRPPVTENAIYSPTRNDAMFPIAMFHLPFYIPDGPSAVNFGAMGSIIGHEITHAFDFRGRQYDGEGKLSDWWEETTAENFVTTTTCMKDQYSDIRVKGVKIDGDFTLDENIADNGGLRAAMYAYQMWIDQYGDELDLPGLNMTMYQVFYTSYAQMYCSKFTDAGLLLHLLTDPHSPGYARVNGVLSNSQTFNWAFQCPLDSPMNPRVKCEVW